MAKTHTEFLRTRDTGEVINASLYFIREHFNPILKSILYIAGPVLLFTVIVSTFYMAGEIGAAFDSTQPVLFPAGLLITLVSNFAAMLVTVVIIAIMYEYIFLCYHHGIRHYEVSEVWNAVKKRILLYFIYSILVGILTFLGFLFLIIPGIYFMVTLSFIYMFTFFENRNFVEAVSRCHEFIQGQWWNTLGLLVLVYLIYYIISLLFSFPALIYGAIIGFLSIGGDGMNVSLIFSFLITMLASVSYVAIILPVTAVAYQYFNIVERKYAPGLSQDIENLKTTV
jgi:hypothetical protein